MDSDWEVAAEWSELRKAEFMRESASRDPWLYEYDIELAHRPRRNIYASVKIEDLSGIIDPTVTNWPYWDRVEAMFITCQEMTEMIRRRGADLTLYDFLIGAGPVQVPIMGYQIWTPRGEASESLITISMLTPLPMCPSEIMFPKGFYRLEAEVHPSLPPHAGVKPSKIRAPRMLPVTFSTQPLRKLIEPTAWNGVEGTSVSTSSRMARLVRRASRGPQS